MYQFLKKISFFFITLSLFIYTCNQVSAYYFLDCTSSTTLISKYRPLFYLSSTTNATVAIASTTGYPIITQCLFDDGRVAEATVLTSSDCFGNITSNDAQVLFNISATSTPFSNSHTEAATLSSYGPNNALCLNVRRSGNGGLFDSSTSTLQMSNCNGYGTTLFSAPVSFRISGNSHIGDANAYPLKFCLTAIFSQKLSVSFDTNSVGFGTLSPSQILYATSDGNGTTTATSSFAMDVSVVGNTDYAVSLSGDTLRNTSNASVSIPGVGSSPSPLTPGTDTFGIQATTTCLRSPCNITRPIIQSPYDTSLFGFNLSTTTQTFLASGSANDYNEAPTSGGSRFLFTLGATASNNLAAGAYTANLTLIVTPTF